MGMSKRNLVRAAKHVTKNPSQRWARTAYGLTAAQSEGVTEAQLAEADYWCSSNAVRKNSPQGQGFLVRLIRTGWVPFGTAPATWPRDGKPTD